MKLKDDIISWKTSSIFEFSSKNSWSTTTIMAWVHWNELAWLEAIEQISNSIDVIAWKVYFIIANLKALQIWERQTEKNLNRCFLQNNSWTTYEDKRAKEIIPYLGQTIYLMYTTH
jgi:succinylglutamate desuccinylase